MDKRSTSSSSKVTVEYHDPSGVFPLIAPSLISRLPLRNLHWNSQSRPLRSINSLHVELVPDSESSVAITSRADAPSHQTQSEPPTTVSRPESSGNGSTNRTTAGAAKERRHQIPGLRQTPYLKIYLLRCDDSENYKASSRKLLREWIKAHTRPTQSTAAVNTQENHDAFEWLIIHVVIPGTPAAAQSRWSAGSGGGSTADKGAGGGARFLGKSSSTIFEKISADFNGSGKTARDRTAQVRLRKDDLLYTARVQMSAETTSYNDDQQERSDPLDDVTSKMKALILTSFDLRVTQYEEDIREKDLQRNLPGWNFCTFFVLKEGLARGFESVGLVEDALTGYDELALGLETVVREQTDGSGDHQSSTFLDHTEALLQEAQLALDTVKDGATDSEMKSSENAEVDVTSVFKRRPESWPLDANKKNYRELILANNISIFDFQCYIFARQLSLLLRLGHGLSLDLGPQENLQSGDPSDQTGSAGRGHFESRDFLRKEDDAENLFALAEVCRRALEFITSVARTMRSDILKGIERDRNGADPGHRQRIGDLREISVLVENMASSWAFKVCQQVLQETATGSVESLLSPRRVSRSVDPEDNQPSSLNGLTTSSGIGPDSITHPARNSSLPSPSPQSVVVATLDSIDSNTYPYDVPRDLKQGSHRPSEAMKPGAEGLVSSRAELYLLARRTASHLGEKCDWVIDYTLAGSQTDSDLEDVPLADDDTKQPHTGISTLASLTELGLQCMSLRLALESKEAFYALYEFLTQESLAHFEAALKTKSVQKCTTDLAILKFHLGDYATAASYFHRIAPFYAEGNWDSLEVLILTFYARCLKKLGRKDDYVRVILKILGKNVAEAVGPPEADGAPTSSGQESSGTVVSSSPSCSSVTSTTEFATDLLSYAAELHREISVPMNRYMRNITVNPYIKHYDDKDGFQLQLSFRCMLGDRLPIQSAKVKISSTGDGPLREIWLESDEPLTLRPGLIKLWLHSNANVYGVYSVTKILLRCQKINFVHDMHPQQDKLKPSSVQGTIDSEEIQSSSQIYCYSRASALEAKLSLSKLIYLEQSRSVEIAMCSGWNNVIEGELRIRAASAGLRLRIAETMPVDDRVVVHENSQTGCIEFHDLPPRTSATLRIPYTSEGDLNELSLKIEISYKTEKGHFFYASNPFVSIALPLGVNVQDNFKEHMLISKFIVSTVTAIPLRMMGSKLGGSLIFDTEPASSLVSGFDILRRQPASLLYKITRKGNSDANPNGGKKAQTSLSLSIDYACVDEEIVLSVEARFLEAIRESPLEHLSSLLLPVLLRSVRSKLTVTELERATLVQEVDLGPFEGTLWPQTLVWLPSATREQAYQWLRNWHEANRVIRLVDSFDPSTEPLSKRQIIIPVEIPSVPVVHTVKLRMMPGDNDGQSSVALAAVGQIIGANLEIKHTQRWDTANVREALSHGEEKSLQFSYEVQANPDSWLVAGRRKGHFHAKENETLIFPLALLPQRAGYLLYPAVEIRALGNRPDRANQRSSAGEVKVESRLAGEVSSSDISQLHCETDYRNQADVMLVLPNLKSSTVGLDPVGPGGSAWLVQSERRVEATMS